MPGRRAGVVQHADDPGRALVGRRREAEPLDQRVVGGEAGDATGRECGTSASSAPSVTTSCTPSASASSMTVLAERAPAVRRLGAREQDEVARGARHARLVDLERPASRSRACALGEPDRRARGLEVDELLGVDRPRSARASSAGADEGQRGGGGLAGVVPALEGAHERGRAQPVGAALPAQRLHPQLTVAGHSPASGPPGRCHPTRMPDARPVPPAAASPRCAPGDEVAGVYACTRKDRLTARTGAPYLALELRDRTGALPARAFRDADVLGGALRARRPRARAGARRALPRRAAGRGARDRARRGRPTRPRSCPSPTATSTSSTASSSTSRARSTTRRTARCSTRCWPTARCAPSGAAPRARAPATTPTSAGCSSTPSRSARSRSRRASCTRGSNSDLLHLRRARPRPRQDARVQLRRGDRAHRRGAAARPRRARPAAPRRRGWRRSTSAGGWRCRTACCATTAPTPPRAGASARPRRSRCTASTRSTPASRARSNMV